jgi:hypothetical protein
MTDRGKTHVVGCDPAPGRDRKGLWVASRYSPERGCGRTARHLAHLLDRMVDGARIVYVTPSTAARDCSFGLAADMLAAGATEGLPYKVRRGDREIRCGRGCIRFRAAGTGAIGAAGHVLVLDHALAREGSG